jgi:hypothetical protein
MISIVTLINILASPRESFVEIKVQPRWGFPFFFMSILAIGVAFLTAPFSRELLRVSLSAVLDEENLEQSLSMMEKSQYLVAFFVPGVLLLKWTAIATVLYLLSSIFGTQEQKFKECFVVVVYSEIILILMGVFSVLLLHLKGFDSLHHLTDLQPIIGLDVLMSDKASDLPLFTFLNSVNLFNIWYVAVLSIGFSIMTDFSKVKSALLVTTVWLLGVGLQVAFVVLSANLYRLQPG